MINESFLFKKNGTAGIFFKKGLSLRSHKSNKLPYVEQVCSPHPPYAPRGRSLPFFPTLLLIPYSWLSSKNYISAMYIGQSNLMPMWADFNTFWVSINKTHSHSCKHAINYQCKPLSRIPIYLMRSEIIIKIINDEPLNAAVAKARHKAMFRVSQKQEKNIREKCKHGICSEIYLDIY